MHKDNLIFKVSVLRGFYSVVVLIMKREGKREKYREVEWIEGK